MFVITDGCLCIPMVFCVYFYVVTISCKSCFMDIFYAHFS